MFLWSKLLLIWPEVVWWSKLWSKLSVWRVLRSLNSGASLKAGGWLHVAWAAMVTLITVLAAVLLTLSVTVIVTISMTSVIVVLFSRTRNIRAWE